MSSISGGGLAVLAGVMQAFFPLPMKYTTKWKWENTWSIFALWGFVVLPWLYAFVTVPNLIGVYASASVKTLTAMTICGFGWGIGTVCFGMGVSIVGFALGFAITIGLTGALGTLVPMLVFHADTLQTSGGACVIGGVLLMLLGICVVAAAGTYRELSEQNANDEIAKGPNSFRKGLVICIVSGITSPMLNFAFAFGDEVITRATIAGASPADASNPIWCWVMTCAFVTTVIYCVYRMSKDRGWTRFTSAGTRSHWVLTFLMGLLWSASITVYGIALSKLGVLAASVGWSTLMTTTIAVGNICGLATGEWREAGRYSLTLLLVGLAILAVAICLIGIGNW